MPDISLCLNKNCLRRLTCYRFMATPSEYQQSYATFASDGYYCPDYWPHNKFPDAEILPTLLWVHAKRRDGDVTKISDITGINKSTVSIYLTKSGQAVLKPLIAAKIIRAFKKIYDERT